MRTKEELQEKLSLARQTLRDCSLILSNPVSTILREQVCDFIYKILEETK